MGKSITNLKVDEQKDYNWAWPALQDKKGTIWFSNWGGAYRYDGKSFMKLVGLSNVPTGPVTRIIEDKKGDLWFGGAGGIWGYDGTSFTHFTIQEGLVNNKVSSFLENKKDNEVWSIMEDNRENFGSAQGILACTAMMENRLLVFRKKHKQTNKQEQRTANMAFLQWWQTKKRWTIEQHSSLTINLS